MMDNEYYEFSFVTQENEQQDFNKYVYCLKFQNNGKTVQFLFGSRYFWKQQEM